jgi:ATP-dependent Clp protease adapter protein ClpS
MISRSNTITLKRRKNRRKVELYLVNDKYNSFDHVIDTLANTLPECSVIKAEQLANITHNKDVCHIYTGKSPEVYYVQTMLIKQGLHVISKKPGKNLDN